MNKKVVIGLMLLLIPIAFAARLPIVDNDLNNWGTILNQFLNVSLDQNGSLDKGLNVSVNNLNVTSLASCDTIDTDANGVLSCGTDDGGGNCSAADSCSNIVYIGYLTSFWNLGNMTWNTSQDIQNAINYSEGFYNIRVNCSNILFDSGFGSAGICDGTDDGTGGGGDSGLWYDAGDFVNLNTSAVSYLNATLNISSLMECNGTFIPKMVRGEWIEIKPESLLDDWTLSYNGATYGGDSEHGFVGLDIADYVYRTVQQFDMSSINGMDIQEAILRIGLHGIDYNGRGMAFDVYYNTTWDFVPSDCTTGAGAEKCWNETNNGILVTEWNDPFLYKQNESIGAGKSFDITSIIKSLVAQNNYTFTFAYISKDDPRTTPPITDTNKVGYYNIGNVDHTTTPDDSGETHTRVLNRIYVRYKDSSLSDIYRWTCAPQINTDTTFQPDISSENLQKIINFTSIGVNCSNIMFNDGTLGASAICDGADADSGGSINTTKLDIVNSSMLDNATINRSVDLSNYNFSIDLSSYNYSVDLSSYNISLDLSGYVHLDQASDGYIYLTGTDNEIWFGGTGENDATIYKSSASNNLIIQPDVEEHIQIGSLLINSTTVYPLADSYTILGDANNQFLEFYVDKICMGSECTLSLSDINQSGSDGYNDPADDFTWVNNMSALLDNTTVNRSIDLSSYNYSIDLSNYDDDKTDDLDLDALDNATVNRSVDLSSYNYSIDLSSYNFSIDLTPYNNSVDLSNYNISLDLSTYALLDSPTFTTAVTVPDAFNIGNKITHTGDTNTEWQVTSDQWNAVTGGSSRLTISNSGVAVSNGNLDMNNNDILEVDRLNVSSINTTDIYIEEVKIYHNGSGVCIGTC